jgi:hypothetical protein
VVYKRIGVCVAVRVLLEWTLHTSRTAKPCTAGRLSACSSGIHCTAWLVCIACALLRVAGHAKSLAAGLDSTSGICVGFAAGSSCSDACASVTVQYEHGCLLLRRREEEAVM